MSMHVSRLQYKGRKVTSVFIAIKKLYENPTLSLLIYVYTLFRSIMMFRGQNKK